MKKLITLLAFAVFCAAAPVFAQDAAVLSYTPTGNLNYYTDITINVNYNQPMVSLGEGSQENLLKCPITLSPAPQGEYSCRWTGTQTLALEIKELTPATRYRASVSALTSEVSGQKVKSAAAWNFTTKSPEVIKIIPSEREERLFLDPVIYVVFNMPVDFETLEQNALVLNMSDDGAPVPFTAERMTKEELRDITGYNTDYSYYKEYAGYALTPAELLDKSSTYSVIFPSQIMPERGTTGIKEKSSYFSTYGPLRVAGKPLQKCLPFTPRINFTNPVSLQELDANITIMPASARKKIDFANTANQNVVAQAYRNWNYFKDNTDNYSVFTSADRISKDSQEMFYYLPLSYFFDMEPGVEYKVTVSKNLKDMFGSTLGRDASFTVKNDGYCPALDISSGFSVVESYMNPYHEIKTTNLSSVDIEALALDENTFIPFYQKSSKNSAVSTGAAGVKLSYPLQNTGAETDGYIDFAKIFKTAPKGMVFWQVKKPGDAAYKKLFDNFTDAGITLKYSPTVTLIYLSSLKTSAPMPGVGVEIRDNNNKVLWTGVTDAQGFAQAPGWEGLGAEKPQYDSPKLWVIAKSADGTAILASDWNKGMDPWRFGISYDWSPQNNKIKTALVTDKDIIRPGEKISFKAALRQRSGSDWKIAPDTKGTLVITDPRGTEFLRQELDISKDYGTASYTLQTPASAVTGGWNARFMLDEKDYGSASYSYFRVEAVKTADFKVSVNTDKKAYKEGENIEVSVDGWYMSGGAMSGAETKINTFYSEAYPSFENYDGFSFTASYDEAMPAAMAKNGALDDGGRFKTALTAPKVLKPVNMFIEAAVTAPDRQQLFARKTLRLDPADFYLGVKSKEYSVSQGKPWEAEVIAVTSEEKPVQTEVSVSIERTEWFSIYKRGLKGRLEWVSEKNTTSEYSGKIKTSDKPEPFSFTPSKPGHYQVELSAADARGNPVKTQTSFYVSGSGDAYWQQRDDDIIKLTADKEEYKKGDTANIIVHSPYEEAAALVTVEREGVFHKFTQTLKGGADKIKIKIEEEYLPNVYVSVMLMKGRESANPTQDVKLDLGKPQVKAGYINLSVRPAERKLDVKVSTNKKSYRPGDKVTVNFTAQSKGKTKPAQTAVFVVDEGLLSLTNFKTPDFFSEFYSAMSLAVKTADSRVYVIAQRNFGEKGENRGGGGGDSASLGKDLRSVFESTPFTDLNYVTGKNGKGSVSFTLPDNLTKFRVMVVALTDVDFGSGDTVFEVNKPVMVKPSLPRFARFGDTFKCGCVVYNYDAPKKDFKIEALAKGSVSMTGEMTRTLTIEKGASQEVLWDCAVTGTDKAEFSFKAASGKESDGFVHTIPVEAVEKYRTLATSGAAETAAAEKVTKPANLDPRGNNRVEITLASTALVDLREGILYLLSYPYGCLEQKMSKVLPIITAETMITDFGLGDISEFKVKTQEVFDRLGDYQTSSGGFSYWTSGYRGADPYTTAYALEVIHLAKQKGYKIDQKVIDGAVNWLNSYITAKDSPKYAYPYSVKENNTAKAYAVYVLGLYPKTSAQAQFSNLYSQAGSLNFTAKIYLLKAAKNFNNAAAVENLTKELLSKAKYSNTSMHFETDEYMPWIHMSNVKATADAAEALIYANGSFPSDEKAAAWLARSLNAQGHWGSTHTNAAVFKALNTYYTVRESAEPDFTAAVSAGAVKAWEGMFKGRSLKKQTAVLPFSDVYQTASADINISKTGAGRLYYTLAQIYAPLKIAEPLSSGFKVEKTLKPLYEGETLPLKAGQRAVVELKVYTAQDRTFVVLEDFLPAGFEIVNTALATESLRDAVSSGQNAYSSYYGFTRSEKYDDRIAAFADYLQKGEHTYSYVIQATTPGKYSMPAAWASQMYEPEVTGSSVTQNLEIKLK